jgi:hypothetical protein
MKKTLLGLAAVGCMLFAGQASASTLADVITTPSAAVKFKFKGVSQESLKYSGTVGGVSGQSETWGLLVLTSVEVNGTDVWASLGNTTQYYGTYHGLYDKSITGSAPNFTINQQADESLTYKPGFDLYQITSGSYTPIVLPTPATKNALDAGHNADNHYTGQGSTLALSGIFTGSIDPTDPAIVLRQEVDATTLPAKGTGFGFGDFTGGMYLSLFGTDGVNNSIGGKSDFSINFTLGNDSNGAGFNIDDPFRTTSVPEPTTMLLFGTGLIGLAGIGRRKLRK